MKKALEAVLVISALALGAYVAQQARARRDSSARPAAASALGRDVENPDAPPAGSARLVTSVPTIKSSRPPNPSRRADALPPPAVAP